MTKWLALIFMLLDHIGLVFKDFLNVEIYSTLRLLGRLSFPLYTYYVVKGLERTRNREKYFKRILFSAIISSIVIKLAFPNLINKMNIMYSFLIYISFAIILENKTKWTYIFLPLLFLFSKYVDYSYGGLLVFLAIYFISKLDNSANQKRLLASASIFLIFAIMYFFGQAGQLQLFAGFAGLLMFNDKCEQRVLNNKKIEKWIFYVAYPSQWILLWMIKTLFI